MVELHGPLGPEVEPPAAVRRLAGDSALRGVWANRLGGLTFAVGDPPSRYVKWMPPGADPVVADLSVEAERMRWAGRHTPVPEVLEVGGDDDGTWLVTAALPGTSAVDARWRTDPTPVVRAIGVGLRALHDALPVAECPFDWSPARRLGYLQPRFEHLRAQLADPPDPDRLVVCHGDACAPNTVVDGDGAWVGHVDLGSLGTADRWADLAVATMSLGWNFGPGWEHLLYEAYGIDPDAERIAYHRLLWDCC
ncbi:MAG: phosphotransferase [Acidimicrobiia bacterium]|jgi:kanamycin kinase